MKTQEQSYISWDDRFSVGIPLIDNQHKKLIDMTNMLHNACRSDLASAKEQFKSTVQEAVSYVKYHFSIEEQIMEKTAYPDFAGHKKLHAEFVQQILTNIADFQSGKKFVPNNFVRFLREWVLSHIAIADSKVGRYIVGLQANGQLGKITIKGNNDTEKKQIILAVDDSKTQLTVYKNILNMYDVYSCLSPLLALEIVKNMHIDLVLLDLSMPEISGFDFLQDLRSVQGKRSLPVIVSTSHSGEKYVVATANLGADDFITKPVDPALLIEKVKALLEKRKSP